MKKLLMILMTCALSQCLFANVSLKDVMKKDTTSIDLFNKSVSENLKVKLDTAFKESDEMCYKFTNATDTITIIYVIKYGYVDYIGIRGTDWALMSMLKYYINPKTDLQQLKTKGMTWMINEYGDELKYISKKKELLYWRFSFGSEKGWNKEVTTLTILPILGQ